jgi:hypothetical protein
VWEEEVEEEDRERETERRESERESERGREGICVGSLAQHNACVANLLLMCF